MTLTCVQVCSSGLGCAYVFLTYITDEELVKSRDEDCSNTPI
jgi:hypothetical protein